MPPVQSRPVQPKKVRKYEPDEVNLNSLATKAYQILHRKPFAWQLEIALAILCGEDVIVDIGTGSGKTLCFSLPLLQDEKNVIMTVSPLTALVNKASTAEIPTVAVCAETIQQFGAEKLYTVSA